MCQKHLLNELIRSVNSYIKNKIVPPAVVGTMYYHDPALTKVFLRDLEEYVNSDTQTRVSFSKLVGKAATLFGYPHVPWSTDLLDKAMLQFSGEFVQ